MSRSLCIIVAGISLFLSGIMIAGSGDDMNLSLVPFWGMDEGEGLVVNDATGANDGVIVGGATWTDGICGNALKSDGLEGRIELQTPVIGGRWRRFEDGRQR